MPNRRLLALGAAISLCWLPLRTSTAHAAVTLVQASPQVGPVYNPTTTITMTLPAASTAGDLLVASMGVNAWGTGGCTSGPQYVAPAGWLSTATVYIPGGTKGASIYYYPSNPGGITTVAFTLVCSGAQLWALNGLVSEYSGIAASNPLDMSSTHTSAGYTTTDTVSATSSFAGDIAVTSWSMCQSVVGGAMTFSPSAGWTNLGSDQTNGDQCHVTYDHSIAGGAGTVSETQTSSSASSWGDGIALFKPAGSIATVTVTAGSLTFLSAPGTVMFPGITLNGSAQTVSQTLPLDIEDTTGSGAGWNVQVASTAYTNGVHLLPASSVAVGSVPAQSCDVAGQCTLAAPSVGYPLTMSTTAQELFNATANTGMGDETVTPSFVTTIPATTYAGTYSATWTFSLTSGP